MIVEAVLPPSLFIAPSWANGEISEVSAHLVSTVYCIHMEFSGSLVIVLFIAILLVVMGIEAVRDMRN